MLESLLPNTKDILNTVENETALRTKLTPSEPHYSSKTLLSSYLADSEPKEIEIAYNPNSRSIDYAVAHEAIRFLRYSRAPPEERYVLISTEDTRMVAYQKMESDLKNVPSNVKAINKRIFSMLYDGILTQLLSTPGDFWVNQWLYDKYPSLRREQEIGLSEIFRLAHQGLRQEMREFIPGSIYRASNSMNAAFAGFIAKLLGEEEFVRPYQGTEFQAMAALLSVLNPIDRGHVGDKETTDAWAKELGLVGWYGWRVE